MLENITSSNPCGDDIKYADSYIVVETEVEKNFNVSNTHETDWTSVINKCEDLLKHQTKDLKLLSYWLYAQYKLNGWNQFLTSFETYIELLKQYNKDLYPKVEKRKIKIFEWLESILQDELLKALDNFNKEQLSNVTTLLETFISALSNTINDSDIFFSDARKKSSQLLQQIELQAKQEETFKKEQEEALLRQKEEEARLAEAQQLRRSEEEETLAKFSSSSVAEVIDNSVMLSSNEIDMCINDVIHLSTLLLEKASADYLSYKLLFSLGEMLIEEAIVKHNGASDDLFPSNDIINAARNLENNKVSNEQLKALIEQILLRPAWIEGYYIISQVLFKLSRKEDALKIENMLFTFLHKEEEMMNNYNLIPETMHEWFQKKTLALNDNGDISIEYQTAYQEVLKVKNEQGSQNALMLLEEHYKKATSQESRFRWKLLFVDFALEIGDKKIALSLLLELERLIEKYALDQWQPELAIVTYEALLQPILTQEINSEIKDRIYNKLSILDMKKVIKLR